MQYRVILKKTKSYCLYQCLNASDSHVYHKFYTLEWDYGKKWDYPTYSPRFNSVTYDKPELIPKRIRISVLKYLVSINN